jgi:hypothetical protein
MALLTQMSMGPSEVSNASAARMRTLSSATSPAKIWAVPPSDSISALVSSRAAASRAISPIRAPARAKRRAVARPTPALAPVITTTRSWKSIPEREPASFSNMPDMALTPITRSR